MAFEFKLPDIGEGVVEGEIVSWKVAVGDRIEVDQPLVEVMTDKATVEIGSPHAGVVTQIGFQEGDICPVGAVMVVIAGDGDGGEAEPESGRQDRSDTSDAIEAAAAAPAGMGATSAGPVSSAPTPIAIASPPSPAGGRVKATPATRKLARELGVELARVPATGKNGRVTSNDVRAFANSGLATAVGAVSSPRAADDTSNVVPFSDDPTRLNQATRQPVPPAESATASQQRSFAPIAIGQEGEEERIPLRGLRKRIADNMSRSVMSAAHFTYVEEIDMTELVELRTRAKQRAAEQGIKLTYLPFIIKAVVTALTKWPQLNAALDETSLEIVRKRYYHIGIATQGPNGLMVTVVRNAERRSILGIASEIQRLADAVQAGTIQRDELSGSTFTITSLGKLGGVMATPIINFPEVGILGVHEMKQKPAVHNGELAIRWLMNLSISLDHRLVDGWDGAMFLQDVKAMLQDPTTMLLEIV